MNLGLIFKAIPWRTILEQLPAITDAVQNTYQRFSQRRVQVEAVVTAEVPAGDDLSARVAQLEGVVRDMQAEAGSQIEVIRQLSEEVTFQARALEILGARQTLLFWVAGSALVLALILLVVTLFWR